MVQFMHKAPESHFFCCVDDDAGGTIWRERVTKSAMKGVGFGRGILFCRDYLVLRNEITTLNWRDKL